jgi:hypothetical protein
MLDFVFFNPLPRHRFVDFLAAHGVVAIETQDDETFGVAIPDDTADELLDEIEAYYEEMMALDQQIFETDAQDPGHHAAGVVLNLASGESVYARVDPLLLGKVMEVLTPLELGELVNAIVDAIEHPDAQPLCHRPDGSD